MAFSHDSFSGEVAGTNLQAHTGEFGAAWTAHVASVDNIQISAAGQLYKPDADQGIYYTSAIPPSAEYNVLVDAVVITAIASNKLHGPAGRIDTADDTMYFVRHQTQGTDRWELIKVVGAVFSVLGSFNQTLTAGQTYRVRLELVNAAKSVYIDGVLRITSSDNVITGAGRAGVRMFGDTDNANNYHLDNLSASTGQEDLVADYGGDAVFNAAAGRTRPVALSVIGTGTFTSAVARHRSLALAETGVAVFTAELFSDDRMMVAFTCSATASLDASAVFKCTLTVPCSASFTSNLNGVFQFAASFAGQAVFASQLSADRPMALVLAGSSVVNFNLGRLRPLALSLLDSSSFVAMLTRLRPLTLSSEGQSAVDLGMVADKVFAAEITGQSFVSLTMAEAEFLERSLTTLDEPAPVLSLEEVSPLVGIAE